MPNPLFSLRKFVQASPPTARCDLCGVAIADDHPHVWQVETGRVLCGCRNCAMLFPGASDSRFRVLGDKVCDLGSLASADDLKQQLGLPVDLMWFRVRSLDRLMIVSYPSPLGLVESQVENDRWQQMVVQHAGGMDLQPDVEAVLVSCRSTPTSCFRVPITECYRLSGLLRAQWQGFQGGPDVWTRLDLYFSELAARARSSSATPCADRVAGPTTTADVATTGIASPTQATQRIH